VIGYHLDRQLKSSIATALKLNLHRFLNPNNFQVKQVLVPIFLNLTADVQFKLLGSHVVHDVKMFNLTSFCKPNPLSSLGSISALGKQIHDI
jgi:hypothetical protein